MLTDAQLDEVKAKVEGGRKLMEVVQQDYPGERFNLVRKALVEKFGREVIQQSVMLANLQSLSVEELNERIATQEARIELVKAIRDSKL